MNTIHSIHMDKQIENWSTTYELLPVHIMIFIVEGKVSYRVNDHHFIAEQGELVIIPKNNYRSGTNYNQQLHTKYTALLKEIEHLPIAYFNPQTNYKFKLRNIQTVLNKLEQLYDEYINQDQYYDIISNSILSELFVLIARELDKPEVTPIKIRYVEAMKDYIIKNIQQKIEIETLSRLINKSPNYAITIFKEVMGCSPIDYSHQVRLIEAGNLILTSDMSIIDITSHLGYYDTSYFNRVFKKYTSMTPTQFKKIGKPLSLADLKKQ